MQSDKLPIGERMAMINTATVIKTPPANCQQKVVIKGLIKGYFNE